MHGSSFLEVHVEWHHKVLRGRIRRRLNTEVLFSLYSDWNCTKQNFQSLTVTPDNAAGSQTTPSKTWNRVFMTMRAPKCQTHMDPRNETNIVVWMWPYITTTQRVFGSQETGLLLHYCFTSFRIFTLFRLQIGCCQFLCSLFQCNFSDTTYAIRWSPSGLGLDIGLGCSDPKYTMNWRLKSYTDNLEG